MKKRIGKLLVDVASRVCGPDLPCYVPGFDKGTFVQDHGYTRYHKKEIPVCGTRHYRGCPDVGVCLSCRTIASPATMKMGRCDWCGSTDLVGR